MAFTAGLLTFLGVEALTESFELQAALPSALGGAGLVLLGVALSFLGMTALSGRLAGGSTATGLTLALLIAIGIGLHNLGEGLAIGASFAIGELQLGAFLIVGFMIHNVTEGLGIAAPLAEGRTVSIARLGTLAVVAGAPAIVGAWIGGFLANDILGVKGLFQGNWNPGYGFAAFALVYLARLNSLWLIPFAYFLSFLVIGGEMMARRQPA